MTNFIALCYGLTIPAVVAVAIYAFFKSYIMRRKIDETESFLTARNQVGFFRIGWSFFAGAVGAWVIASPANFAAWGGMLGLVMYSLASGLPFVMIAYAGDKIQRKLPHVLSLTDYAGWRFGMVAKSFVLILTLFNMSIAMLAEYTTIGSIFKDYVGSQPYPIIIVIGLLTTAYTATGGLLVSIYTDTVQGLAATLFFAILALYMAIDFRPDSLPTPMPCSPDDSFCISGTPNCGDFDDAGVECPITGYSSILTMPASLFTATVFSEAMWQRAWASRDKKTLVRGAWMGAIAVVLVVFFAGLCGLLAAWAGLITYDTNSNLYLFQVLNGGQVPPTSTIFNWIGVICVLLAAIMNEGAVDSLENGMVAGVASYLSPVIKSWKLLHTRLVVLLLNSGLIGIAVWLTVGTVKVGVLELFLITNQLCISSAVPVLAGLVDRLHPFYGAFSFLFSCLFSIFSLCVFGVNYYYRNFPDGFDDPYVPGRVYHAGSFNSAMFYTWIGNGYKWQFFLVPLCVSIGCIMLTVAINWLLVRFKARRMSITGFTAPATHPDLFAAPSAPSPSGSEKEDGGELKPVST